MFYSTKYTSNLGEITLASDGTNLSGLWLAGQKYFGGPTVESSVTEDNLPIFKAAKNWLNRYFQRRQPPIAELPLAPIGSGFRKAVWKLLCEIPYGEVATYGEIARKLMIQSDKKTMSSQAVGGAVSHNPISIIIPCHRVVGTNGSLTGYAGGINKKIQLLKHEGVDMSHLFAPSKGTAL